MGTCEVSATSSILREGKHQALPPRVLVEVHTGMCVDRSDLAPKGNALISLSHHPHEFSKKGDSRRNEEAFISSLQPRECMFPYKKEI